MKLYYQDEPNENIATYWSLIRPYIVRRTIRWTRDASGRILIITQL